MMKVQVSRNEEDRLKALYNLDILDTESEDIYDELARLAAYISRTPIAAITFVDGKREWFKSIVGMESPIREVPRDLSLGAHVILESKDVFTVFDPLADEDLKKNPILDTRTDIRYYAGVPIVTKEGHSIGTLSILGHAPKDLTFEQIMSLRTIAKQVMVQLELRRNVARLEESREHLRQQSPSPYNEPGTSLESTNIKQSIDTLNQKLWSEEFQELIVGDEINPDSLKDYIMRMELYNQKMMLLNEMDEMLLAAYRVDEVYSIITSYAQKLFPEESGALYIINETSDLLENALSWGDKLFSERAFIPHECWAFRRGEVHAVEDTENEPVCKHLVPLKGRSYMCAPLLSQGLHMGMVYMQAPVHENGNNDSNGHMPRSIKESKVLVASLAKHSGLAIGNLKLRETLQDYAVHDALTGLFNRRYMEETLKREISRVTRKKVPLGVIMLDIDYFKEFNDQHGHPAGDELLRRLGTFLQEQIRREDIACRYGGEEFILILPESSLENTRRRAEQIKEDIKGLHVWYKGKLIDSVNVSMGVVVFSEHGTTVESLLESADKALYKAKNEGRDRIVVAN